MMKKRIAVIFVMLFAFVLALSSCELPDMDKFGESTTYTVTFETGNGSAVAPVEVSEGSLLKAPQAPTREGYTFAGWYKDSSLSSPWRFDKDTVDKDITLYAGWKKDAQQPPKHECNSACPECGKCLDEECKESVCSNKCNCAEEIHKCESTCSVCEKCIDLDCNDVACAEKCECQSLIHKCDSVCGECGKCLDEECKESACIEKCQCNVTPTPVYYTITFAGADVASQTVLENTAVTKPQDPKKDGYTFLGWYLGETLYDFSTPVTGNINLEAKWNKNEVKPDPDPGVEITGEIELTLAEAGLETIYFEWKPLSGVDGYVVYYDGIRVDNELIRSYGDYYRCDILGLTASRHTVRLVPVKNGTEYADYATEFSATPKAHVREGFAFVGNGDANGAYNADGTLKANAVVIYVTNENKDAISLDMKTDSKKTETRVGIQNIILGLKKGYYEYPICIRFIGNITDPATLDKGDLVIDINNGAFTKGITIEGVGNDATFNGFGLRLKGAKNVEIRNLGFMNCDSNEGDNLSLQQDNYHIWVHNCDFFYGDAGSDADQAKGDGALDVKQSSNVTISFNHYYDSGKCNLQGMKSESTENCITYHHNWYDHSDSRHPRVRTCTIHVYNNFYDGVSKYGIGATSGCSIFSEANYFLNTKIPMMISKQGTDAKGDGTFSGEAGGIIKSYGDVMKFTISSVQSNYSFIPYSSNSTSFDAYVASSRNEVVPSSVVALSGGTQYSNFDTSSSMYSYNVQSAEDARNTVVKYAGRVQGGDFDWTFTDADASSYDVNTALKSALKSYKSSLVSVGGVDEVIPPSTDNENNGEGGSNENAGNGSTGSENTGNENSGTNSPTPEGAIVHNFHESGKTSAFFTINGNLSSSKGTITYNGMTLTQCLKIESSTNISFTITEAKTLTLVFGNAATCKINGEKHTSSTNILTVELEAGTYSITKADTENLYYMIIE